MRLWLPRLVLALLNLALAAGLAAYWLAAPAWPEPAVLLPDSAALAVQPVEQPPLEAGLAALIAERPLFNPGRSAAGGGGKAGSFEEARLIGLLGNGSASVAIVSSGGAIRRLRNGDQLDGWTLRGGDGRSARFARGEIGDRELFMAHAAQKPPVPPAAANANVPSPPNPSAAEARLPAAAQTAQAGDAPPAADDNSPAARRARREARRRAQAN